MIDLIEYQRVDRKIEKLYLPTLTLSTEADFHRGRVKENYKNSKSYIFSYLQVMELS